MSFGVKFFENGYENWYYFSLKIILNLNFTEKPKEISSFR